MIKVRKENTPLERRGSVLEKERKNVGGRDEIIQATVSSKEIQDAITKAVNDKPATVDFEPSEDLMKK